MRNFKYRLLFGPLHCLLITACYLLFLPGCATAPRELPPKAKFNVPGIYHRVEKGQTLWRISKSYATDLDEIVKINRISNAASIEPGQLIFIPFATQKKQYAANVPLGEDFSWPLKGRVIAGFGQVFNDMVNKGINIQKTKGHSVTASRGGKVIFYSSNFETFGKTIIIDHGDGFSTVYSGNSEVLVKTGDYVQRGMLIAKIGSYPGDKNSYLHFEIRKGYVAQNPYFYLP